MRDRLIELFDKWNLKQFIPFHTERAMLADFLLANGVIVPPCKVEDTVYFLMGGFAEEMKVIRLNLALKPNDKHPFDYLTEFDDFGKTVFLTREEAEQALKGGAK